MNRLYQSLGRAYPRGYRASVGELLRYSGSETAPDVWLGSIMLANLVIIGLILVLWSVLDLEQNVLNIVGVCAGATIFLQASGYMLPYYSAERRAKAVESILPSFYQLMASYLRSGMTPFQALKSASKKEFGLLKYELDVATSRALGTQSFTDALLEMCNRLKSDSLKRTTELMARAMSTGGSLAKLLEESASNLVESRSMRRELIATTRTYTIMVVFAVVIGAPLLLSISTRFNERLAEMNAEISTDVADVQGLQLGMITSGGAIEQDFLMQISVITLLLTSIISSFLVGIIIEGKEKYGFKYAVFFVPLALGCFFAFRSFLVAFF